MNHNDDAYATMLITMALSPNREEYARPYSSLEFQRLQAAIHTAGHPGDERPITVRIGVLNAGSQRRDSLFLATPQLLRSVSSEAASPLPHLCLRGSIHDITALSTVS